MNTSWSMCSNTVFEQCLNVKATTLPRGEKELIRRAEIEDAVLIAHEKQHAAQELERAAAIKKADRVSQCRQERAELNARKVMAREAELATRTNKTPTTIQVDYVAVKPERKVPHG